MSDGTTHVEDEDIVTTWRPDAASPTATVTDPQDADGVDGDGTDGVDGDDADGTDSGDTDTVDTGDDADGTDR
jgi:hypothetical protein